MITRRHLLAGIAASAVMPVFPVAAGATALPEVTAFRQPGCGCCEVWVLSLIHISEPTRPY